MCNITYYYTAANLLPEAVFLRKRSFEIPVVISVCVKKKKKNFLYSLAFPLSMGVLRGHKSLQPGRSGSFAGFS